MSCDRWAIQGCEAMKGKSFWETGSAQINHAQRIYKGEHEKSGEQLIQSKCHCDNKTSFPD